MENLIIGVVGSLIAACVIALSRRLWLKSYKHLQKNKDLCKKLTTTIEMTSNEKEYGYGGQKLSYLLKELSYYSKKRPINKVYTLLKEIKGLWESLEELEKQKKDIYKKVSVCMYKTNRSSFHIGNTENIFYEIFERSKSIRDYAGEVLKILNEIDNLHEEKVQRSKKVKEYLKKLIIS